MSGSAPLRPPSGAAGPAARRPLRAVVTDVDGTLTDSRRRLHLPALEAIRRLEDSGIPVVLATGNVLPIALAVHRFLGLTGPVVAENGGITFREDGERERVERLADRSVAMRAYRTLLRREVPVRRLFTDRWRESEVALEPNVPVARLQKLLAGQPVRVESTGFAIHLMEAGAGKLPALTRVLADVGLSVAECVVLGDGDNDVEMLRAAGFGVSFPSGSRKARAAARYVTHAEDGDGFVEGLKASQILA